MLAVADAFTTDGVSLHLGMQKPKAPSSQPSSSVHYIDALKAAMRSADDLHVIGSRCADQHPRPVPRPVCVGIPLGIWYPGLFVSE